MTASFLPVDANFVLEVISENESPDTLTLEYHQEADSSEQKFDNKVTEII